MKVGTWSDYYSEQDKWTPLNLIGIDIIDQLDCEADECVGNLKDNPSLAVHTIDPITSNPFLIHHFTQIGGCLLMKDPKMVAGLPYSFQVGI